MNISTKNTFKSLMRENRTFLVSALLTCLFVIGANIALAESLHAKNSSTQLNPVHSGHLKTSDQQKEAQTDAAAESDDCD